MNLAYEKKAPNLVVIIQNHIFELTLGRQT